MLLGCLSDRNSPGHSGRSVHHGTDGNRCSSRIDSLPQGSGNEGAQAPTYGAMVRRAGRRLQPAVLESTLRKGLTGCRRLHPLPPPSRIPSAPAVRVWEVRGAAAIAVIAPLAALPPTTLHPFCPDWVSAAPRAQDTGVSGLSFPNPLNFPPPWPRVSGASEWGTGRGLTES